MLGAMPGAASSTSGAYVSIRSKEGKEIVLLKALDDLDEASRAIVQLELHDKVFNPKITRVVEHPVYRV